MRADEDRWWKLIDGSFPSEERLVTALRLLSREELLAFGVHVRECRLLVPGPWNGLDIAGAGVLSEAATEELTDWIVGQRKAYWQAAVDAARTGCG